LCGYREPEFYVVFLQQPVIIVLLFDNITRQACLAIIKGNKMRCLACDCELSDLEAIRKDSHGVYVDFCNKCYQFTKDEITYIEIEKELQGIIDE
jgi:hypothetical protein